MDDWKAAGHSGENYRARRDNGGGDTYYTWGALRLAVSRGMEQYIDENPWEGIRFGALSPPADGEFHGALWENWTYNVIIGSHRTAVMRDGKLRLDADHAVVVRHYQPHTFTIKCVKPVHVTTAEFDSGSFELKIDGKSAGTVAVPRGQGTFALAAGEHAVELVH